VRRGPPERQCASLPGPVRTSKTHLLFRCSYGALHVALPNTTPSARARERGEQSSAEKGSRTRSLRKSLGDALATKLLRLAAGTDGPRGCRRFLSFVFSSSSSSSSSSSLPLRSNSDLSAAVAEGAATLFTWPAKPSRLPCRKKRDSWVGSRAALFEDAGPRRFARQGVAPEWRGAARHKEPPEAPGALHKRIAAILCVVPDRLQRGPLQGAISHVVRSSSTRCRWGKSG
jgi:hypothetical protein